MIRKIAVLALLWCAACYSKGPSLGTCNVAADCTLPDGGEPAGVTCNSDHVCAYACSSICAPAEACVNGACELQGPRITLVTAPTTWSPASSSQFVTVTAVVDDTGGPGIASAVLRIAGASNIAGTTSETGLVRTYTFSVPGSVQAVGSETPVNFTIVATDSGGGVTPDRAAGTGQLRIDGKPPAVSGVTVTNGIAGPGGIPWVKSQPGFVDVVAVVQEGGSGINVSKLKLISGGVQFDQPSIVPPIVPYCTFGTTTACHFNVPQDKPGSTQVKYDFTVVGQDAAGNDFDATTTSASMGIDGAGPTVVLSGGTASYPAKDTGCEGTTSVYCGHDGSHFWRNGEPASAKVNVTVSDGNGSGSSSAVGAVKYCYLPSASAPACTPSSNANFESGSTFSIPASGFHAAPFSSDTKGSGNIFIQVTAQDAVGNPTTAVLPPVGLTRVKWVRGIGAAPGSLAGAPLVAEQLGLVIVAGLATSGDPIVAFKTSDGSLAWGFGAGKFTQLASNMALDPTPSTDSNRPSPMLYLNTSGGDFYAMHFTATAAASYCMLSIPGLAGSPVIFGGGTTGYAILAAGDTAYSVRASVAGTGCPITGIKTQTIATGITLGPPSANGASVYFGYKNGSTDQGVKSVQSVGADFGAIATVSATSQPTAGTTNAAVSPASDAFFAVNNNHTVYRYGAALGPSSLIWSTATVGTNVFSQPLVAGGSVFTSTTDLEVLTVNGTSPTSFGLAATQVSPPTITSDTIFVSDTKTGPVNELLAFDRANSPLWLYRGDAATTPGSGLSSIATEATLASDGTLYFGDSSGHVYALITDTTPTPAAAAEWPRTGYDNCNSNHANNTGFVCQ